jgi:Ca2+-binding EF-hand superfamily protein
MSSLKDAELESFRQAFNRVASSSGGKLNEQGMRQFLMEFDIDGSFAPAIMQICCEDMSESVEFDQIRKFVDTLMEGNLRSFFRVWFDAIDSNKDGALAKDDLVKFSKSLNDNMTEADAEKIISMCDTNCDGKVDFDDFWRWYKMEHGIQEPGEIPTS